MSGRYLRKIIPGATRRDPTMTYVADPAAFAAGDCIIDMDGKWSVITRIDDNQFGNPDIRFAHLRDMSKDTLAELDIDPASPHVHDISADERDTFRMNAVAV